VLPQPQPVSGNKQTRQHSWSPDLLRRWKKLPSELRVRHTCTSYAQIQLFWSGPVSYFCAIRYWTGVMIH